MNREAGAVTYVSEQVAARLDRIAQFFVSGSKLTLIVRQANKDEQDFILTNDDIDEAIKALERSKARSAS
jgi:hypothetical protein